MSISKERFSISLKFPGENNCDLSIILYLEAMQGKVKESFVFYRPGFNLFLKTAEDSTMLKRMILCNILTSALYCCPMTMTLLGSVFGRDCFAPTLKQKGDVKDFQFGKTVSCLREPGTKMENLPQSDACKL